MDLKIDNEPIIKAATDCWDVYFHQGTQEHKKTFMDAFMLGYQQCIAHLSSEFSMAVINMFCDAINRKKGGQDD